MALTIRYATEEDAHAILAITVEAFSKYAHDLGKREFVYALNETTYDIILDMDRKHVLVGQIDGQTVGSIRFEVFGDIAYVSRFGVSLDFQKFGVGRALLTQVHTLCQEMGLKAAVLHTSSRMYSLMRFYYGNQYFVHSTRTDRGYIRALLVHEFEPGAEYDLTPIWDK